MNLNHAIKFVLLIVVYLAAALTVVSQDAGTDVHLRLSFANDKNVYRIGEPIKLILSFTATQPGYVLEREYSPRYDAVIITPATGIYDWLNRLNRLDSYDDVRYATRLSQIPVILDLTINNLVRFDKPGKYKVKVLSRRVGKPQPSAGSFLRPHSTSLLSNEIEFEVKEMTEADEMAEVKRISALMDAAKELNEYQIFKQDFDYLTGDTSTVEKVRRFLNPPVFGGVKWLDSGVGLSIARNKQLAIKMLEDVLFDPSQEVRLDLIGELVHLRLLLEDERQPSQAENAYQLRKEREARSSELNKAYYDALLESLSKRMGRNRLVAAYTIFIALPKTDTSSSAYNATRTILLEKFDELTPYERVELLDRFWDKIKNPALISSLEKLLSGKEPEPAWGVRPIALKRLLELDQKRARPFVIEEIKDFYSSVDVNILAALDDKFLPEIDDALLENVRQAAPLKVKTRDYQILYTKNLLAARYATPKIYKDLMDIYKATESGWLENSRDALIGYFLRHNRKDGFRLIEEREQKLGDEADQNIFSGITQMNFPPVLKKFFRKRLETNIAPIVSNAAYYLGKYGEKEDRKLLEKRHQRWLKEWGPRRAELGDPKTDSKIRQQAMTQIELIEAQITGKAWKLSDLEIKQLKLECVTQFCRQFFSIRYLSKEN